MTLTARILALLLAALGVGHHPRRHRARHQPMQSALASWYYAAGGPIACGGDSYQLGVANRTLPCGTRLEVCYRLCVRAIVFDRGPAAWTGREFDLSQQVANATGFSGVASIRWRLAR